LAHGIIRRYIAAENPAQPIANGRRDVIAAERPPHQNSPFRLIHINYSKHG
jgi:hypothetical protein